MLFKQIQRFFRSASKVSVYNLAFCWSLFLTVGVWIGELSADSVFLTLSYSFASNASYFSSILFRLIIFISSLIFVQTGMLWGILALASIRGICYGFLIGSTCACFGNAGWLLCLLYYFTSSICLIIELLFWSLLINAKGRKALKYALISFALELVVILVDSLYISTFTSVLI